METADSSSQNARHCGDLLLYYDPVVLEHDTGEHPECANRILPTVRHLNAVALAGGIKRRSWRSVTREQLARVHAATYIESVRRFAAAGGGLIELDTVVSPRSYDVAQYAVGAVCDAVEAVIRGGATKAFCLVRPPGHHALQDSAMGFCLFNNVAVGALIATEELGIDRVLIVDWDVHHGNGTQATFWEDERVGYLSIHRWPFYLGTGAVNEAGEGRGAGMTLNLPIEFGTPRAEYLAQFRDAVAEFAERVQPQLVMISAGFDSHRLDPIGSLGLESEDFGALSQIVLDVAEKYAAGRVVSVLEGGYHPQALADSVAIHVDELLGA